MIFKWFENSLDNIKIYEIQHNLRSLIFMIFKWFENSLDNIKIHNYI